MELEGAVVLRDKSAEGCPDAHLAAGPNAKNEKHEFCSAPTGLRNKQLIFGKLFPNNRQNFSRYLVVCQSIL